MNNQNKQNEDILKQYIDPHRIEKVSEGFTHNVMTRIRLETEPVRAVEKGRSVYLIPVISICSTIVLIATAYFLPETARTVIPGMSFLQDLKFPDIKINLGTSLNIPVLITYLMLGIILLAILDTALYRLFHREKKSH